MPAYSQTARGGDASPRWFATTHWSVVLRAGETASPLAAEALAKLCHAYWAPIRAYLRSRGYNPHDAEDLTQQFFARFLQREQYRLADPTRGKFRTFLLTTLQHLLVNEWEKEHAAKRGGGRANFVSLQESTPEERIPPELVDPKTAEEAFERRWALAVLEAALRRLHEECAATDRSTLFAALKDFLWGEKSGAPYSQIATELGLTEGAVKVAVHRLRARFRALLRQEVAHTVGASEEVDEELKYLIRVLAR